MMFDFETKEIYCRGCRWKEESLASISAYDGEFQTLLMGLIRSDIRFDPHRHFLTWINRIIGMTPASELGNIDPLINKLRSRMKIEKNETPSVEDCRRWLKGLGRTKLYNYTTSILLILTKTEHPQLEEHIMEKTRLRFRSILNARCKLNLNGNRCYYPYYIYKIFYEILEGERRWVLDYIHLKSMQTHVKCDKEWALIKRNLES